jgi:hypothetical protein
MMFEVVFEQNGEEIDRFEVDFVIWGFGIVFERFLLLFFNWQNERGRCWVPYIRCDIPLLSRWF